MIPSTDLHPDGTLSTLQRQSKRRLVIRLVGSTLAALVVLSIVTSWFLFAHGFRGVALGSSDNSLGSPLWTYHHDGTPIYQINWTPDSGHLSFNNGSDDSVHILDMATKQLQSYSLLSTSSSPGVHPLGQTFGSSEGISPDGHYISRVDDEASSSKIHLQVWDVLTGKQLLNYSYDLPSPLNNSPGFQWSDDSTHVAVGDNNGRILIWDAFAKQSPFLLTGINARLSDIEWCRDGRHIVASTANGWVEVWDIITRQYTLSVPLSSSITSLALSPDGKRLAVVTDHRTIVVLDAVSGKQLLMYPDVIDQDYLVPQWSPDSQHLVSVNVDTARQTQTLRIWDTTTGHTLVDAPIEFHINVVLSPDGRYVAAEDAGKSSVYVWDTTTGRQVSFHDNAARPVGAFFTWSPDARYLATVRSDNAVQVWNATTGKDVYTYQSSSEAVMQIIWSPDGKNLAILSTQLTYDWLDFTGDHPHLNGSSIKIWQAPA